MQRIELIIRYIRYLQLARTKYDIHPPYLYKLITQVLEDNSKYPAYEQIEGLKAHLLDNRQKIQVTDLGAGSSADKNPLRSIRSITRHSSKPAKYGRLLYRLARYLQPQHVLELGTAMGLSAAYLATGYEKASITTVEGCGNILQQARANLNSLGIQNVTWEHGNFSDVLPLYLEQVPQLDLAFIDGNHREQPTISYFEQCLSKTVNSSCLIVDDIHWSEGMENAWNYIVNHEKVTLSLDLFFMGIVFFGKELSKEHHIIRF